MNQDEVVEVWPVGEARLFERTEDQDEDGRRDAWTRARCLCGVALAEAWTGRGVHHGVDRCARVVVG